MNAAAKTPESLKELEISLQNLSHDLQSLTIIQSFAQKIGKTKARQKLFNTNGALVRPPIEYQVFIDKGLISPEEDPFILLQGDIISSDAAYFMGERITGMKFAIASSTCDLVPNRRQYATLLRLQPITVDNPYAKQLLGEMLKFTSTQRMYLPPLPGDRDTVLANAILFDGLVQIRLEDLLMSTRHASLSLVGWRIFGSLVRTIMVRAGESEVKMRTSLQTE
ncbi:hypothetical protein Sta7437_4566 (plasmid) [Stanieria cyanosphaera PCC 7437]|uniref:Uncharacterized protein n=1 Tax=Stanieria cyanosphaera (strain ATCC 29371 / PCC 7437) TaxID=111780 RepID=K9XZK0_STAC7|nr:hypothetical protein [Stanieria cyanosphaera]AFZ38025.1 hypothetical protein Sta7437_4566 [Stanieria cyanosphaera PCC 7437]